MCYNYLAVTIAAFCLAGWEEVLIKDDSPGVLFGHKHDDVVERDEEPLSLLRVYVEKIPGQETQIFIVSGTLNHN